MSFTSTLKRAAAAISSVALLSAALVGLNASAANAAPVAASGTYVNRSFVNGDLTLKPGESFYLSMQVSSNLNAPYDISTLYAVGDKVTINPNIISTGLTITQEMTQTYVYDNNSGWYATGVVSQSASFPTPMLNQLTYTQQAQTAGFDTWTWRYNAKVANTSGTTKTYHILPTATLTQGSSTSSIAVGNYTVSTDMGGNGSLSARVSVPSGSYTAVASDTSMSFEFGSQQSAAQCLVTNYSQPTFLVKSTVTADNSPITSSANGETLNTYMYVQDNSTAPITTLSGQVPFSSYYVDDSVSKAYFELAVPLSVMPGTTSLNVYVNGVSAGANGNKIATIIDSTHISIYDSEPSTGSVGSPNSLTGAYMTMQQWDSRSHFQTFNTPLSKQSVTAYGSVQLSSLHPGSAYNATIEMTDPSGTAAARVCGVVAPTGASAIVQGSNSIQVNIPSAVAGATSYMCAAFTNGSATPISTGTLLESNRPTQKCYISGLNPSTTYTVKVASVSAEGTGAFTAIAGTYTTTAQQNGCNPSCGPSYAFPTSLTAGAAGAAGTSNAIIAANKDLPKAPATTLDVQNTYAAKAGFSPDGLGNEYYWGANAAHNKYVLSKLLPTGYDTTFGGASLVANKGGKGSIILPVPYTSMLGSVSWYAAPSAKKWFAIAGNFGMNVTPTYTVMLGNSASSTVVTKTITTAQGIAACKNGTVNATGLMAISSVSGPTLKPTVLLECMKSTGMAPPTASWVVAASVNEATGALTPIGVLGSSTAFTELNHSSSFQGTASVGINYAATGSQTALYIYVPTSTTSPSNMQGPPTYSKASVLAITAAGAKKYLTNLTSSVTTFGLASFPPRVYVAPGKTVDTWVATAQAPYTNAPTPSLTSAKVYGISAAGVYSVGPVVSVAANAAYTSTASLVPLKQLSNGTVVFMRNGSLTSGQSSLRVAAISKAIWGTGTKPLLTGQAVRIAGTGNSRNIATYSFGGAKVNFFTVMTTLKYTAATWTTPTN